VTLVLVRSPRPRNAKQGPAPVAKTVQAPEARAARIINGAWEPLQDHALSTAGRRLLAAQDVDGFLNTAPWADFITKLGQVTTPLSNVIKTAAAGEYMNVGRGKVSVDMTAIDALSVKYAQTQGSKLIRSITDTQRATVRAVMGESLSGQYDGDKAARLIRDTVGLHPAWAQAVVNQRERVYQSALKDGLTPVKAEARADKLSERYAAKLLRRRADNIARTEILTAENLGRFATWADATGNGYGRPDDVKEWDAELNECCESCREIHGEVVQWDKPFSNGLLMPPAHPSCRCAVSKYAKPRKEGEPGYDPELDDPEHLYQPGYESRLPAYDPKAGVDITTDSGIRVQVGNRPLATVTHTPDGDLTPEGAAQEIDATFKPGTDDERTAAGLYMGGARYNAALRSGSAIDEYTQKYIDDLNGFMAKQPGLSEGTTVYRGLPNHNFPDNLKPGDILHEPAFMSTSHKLDEAEIFAGTSHGTIVETRLPKGTKGLSINHATLRPQPGVPEEYREVRHALDGEAEYLLPSNTRHRIISIENRTVDGKTYQWVTAELEPPAHLVPTVAKTQDFSLAALTKHSEDELMDMVGKYGDDPDALDAIFAAIDHKAEFDVPAPSPAAVSEWGDGSAYLTPTPGGKPHVPARKLSRDEQTSEEFDAYVSTSYAKALEATAGNFIKRSMAAEAAKRGITSETLFTGPVATAKKFASEELIAFWEENGRQTWTSYRYHMFHMPADAKAAEVVRRAGFQGTLGAVRDRSNF
jgi:hypothetical protein